MKAIAIVLLLLPVLMLAYAYIIYPLLLRLLAGRERGLRGAAEPLEWPFISITVPAYNEGAVIRGTLENLLDADYPPGRREILVISDASTDATDSITGEYADRGVKLIRLPERRGKTVAENLAGEIMKGEICVNLDASIRIHRGSLKALVRAFQDPTVGVASGRDISVSVDLKEGNQGEAGYVDYEMWVRSLETRLGSIVGASGCFYAFRKSVYDTRFPERLSRDFAVSLEAREKGLRSVSVDDALCVVPRAASLQAEFRRKIRTMSRGIETLWFKRELLNPFRYGAFALMLWSHKLARWLVYPLLPLATVGLVILSFYYAVAAALLALSVIVAALGLIALRWPQGRRVPALLAIPGFFVASNVAGVLAWAQLLRKDAAFWEPTRRAV